MKIVFSSIINATAGDWPAEEAASSGIGVLGRQDVAQPESRLLQPKPVLEDYKEKSSQEVFKSLINASSCANLRAEKSLDGFLTFAPSCAFLRDCLH